MKYSKVGMPYRLTSAVHIATVLLDILLYFRSVYFANTPAYTVGLQVRHL